jgi:tripartite-type tricarboxylate transporter receptor subunit TctC
MFKSVIRFLLVLSMVGTGFVHASGYPDKPIRIIAPYAPGGGVDMVARLLAVKLQEKFNQPVIVENRIGASGMIAAQLLSRADPNGYTLLLDAVSITMNPSIHKKLPYDPAAIQPVAKLITLPMVLAVNPSIPPKTLSELTDYLKANSASVNFALAGTSTRLAAELFKLTSSTNFTMVPYQGSAPSILSLLSGTTQFTISDLPSISQHIASGKIRAIASSAGKRTNLLPNVPTAREMGLTDFVVTSWYGVFAPVGTPPELLRQLNTEINRIIVLPDVVQRFTVLGAEPDPMSVDEFSALYNSEIIRWRDVVKRSGMVINE